MSRVFACRLSASGQYACDESDASVMDPVGEGLLARSHCDTGDAAEALVPAPRITAAGRGPRPDLALGTKADTRRQYHSPLAPAQRSRMKRRGAAAGRTVGGKRPCGPAGAA